jgi:hypothetical protein
LKSYRYIEYLGPPPASEAIVDPDLPTLGERFLRDVTTGLGNGLSFFGIARDELTGHVDEAKKFFANPIAYMLKDLNGDR